MATCKCGGVTIKPKKVAPKKVQPKKVQPKKATGNQSARSQRLSAAATKKATKLAKSRPNPFAKGCNCS
jgi:hypothetical protein